MKGKKHVEQYHVKMVYCPKYDLVSPNSPLKLSSRYITSVSTLPLVQWNLGIRDTQGTVENCCEFWGGVISQVHFQVVNRSRDESICPYFSGCLYFTDGLKDRLHWVYLFLYAGTDAFWVNLSVQNASVHQFRNKWLDLYNNPICL